MKKLTLLLLTSCSILVHIKGPEARIITLGEKDGIGLNPTAMVSEDFNSDGIPDLAVANLANTVSILLGSLDGSFSAQGQIPVGRRPIGIVAADFNNDSTLDLATLNDSSKDVSVLLGNGDGTFQAAQTFSANVASLFISTADLNQDNIQDLLVGAPASLLLGNGDGTFQPLHSVLPSFGASLTTKLADLDQDGILDLVTAGQSETPTACCDCFVLAALGNGDGSFQTARESRILGAENIQNCGPFDVGDINGDGILDVISGFDATHEAILLGNGDGFFQAPIQILTDFLGPIPILTGFSPIGLADLDQDGALDLFTTNGQTMELLFGDGLGNFQPAPTFQFASGLFRFQSQIIKDFNLDSKNEIAMVLPLKNEVTIVFGIYQ